MSLPVHPVGVRPQPGAVLPLHPPVATGEVAVGGVARKPELVRGGGWR